MHQRISAPDRLAIRGLMALCAIALFSVALSIPRPASAYYDERYFTVETWRNSTHQSGSGSVRVTATAKVSVRAFFCGFLWLNDCMNFKDGHWTVSGSWNSGRPANPDMARLSASVDVDYWKIGISGFSISAPAGAGVEFQVNRSTVGCSMGDAVYSAPWIPNVSLKTAAGFEFCKVVQPASMLHGVVYTRFSRGKTTTSGAVRLGGWDWRAAIPAVATKHY